MDTLTVSAAIIAVTEAIKRSFPKINGLITMAVALILGIAAGYFHLQGLDLVSGAMAGLAAVGVHTTASVMMTSNPS